MTPTHPPADAAPPGRPRRLAPYLAAAALACLILAAGQRLGSVDLTAPFEDADDTLLILPMVKATVESGHHWTNDWLGAPGRQQLYDYPVIDQLHFAALWLLGQLTGNAVVAFNLYYLLTYPLAAVGALAVLRHFAVSVPVGIAAALLYAFLPYHHLRGEHHYFLAAYYLVPASLVPALWVCRGRLPFFRPDAAGRPRFAPRSRDAAAATAVALAVSAAGAYYAFFACAFLGVAGCYGWVAHRTWRAAAAAGLVVAVVVAGGVACHAPSLLYQWSHGHNPASTYRWSVEAEVHGLKLTHLLLPVAGHQSDFLADLAATYDTPDRPMQFENRWAGLGLVGGAGLVGLLAAAVLPVPRRWPVGPLAALTVFAVLLGVVGGLGSLLAHVVSPHVRAYNRVSVFVAFLCLFAVAHAADRLLAGRPGWVRWAACAAATAFGLWDQCPAPWFRPDAAAEREAAAERWRADAAFYGRVEAAMPGAAVFTLPYEPFPEYRDSDFGYRHVLAYLHTDTLRFSYGAMRARYTDLWQREAAAAPPDEFLRRILLRGFDAALIDRRRFDPAAVLAAAGDAPRFDHPDGTRTLLDLRPYAARLHAELGGRFADLARAEAEAVRVEWLDGFVSFEPLGRESRCRWCAPTGEAAFVNPSDRPRTFDLAVTFRTDHAEPGELVIGGAVWSDRLAVSDRTPERRYEIAVPAGRHRVRFRLSPPPTWRPADTRRLAFRLEEFRLAERAAE